MGRLGSACSSQVVVPVVVVVAVNWCMFFLLLSSFGNSTDQLLSTLHGEVIAQHETSRRINGETLGSLGELNKRIAEMHLHNVVQFDSTIDVMQQVGNEARKEAKKQTKLLQSIKDTTIGLRVEGQSGVMAQEGDRPLSPSPLGLPPVVVLGEEKEREVNDTDGLVSIRLFDEEISGVALGPTAAQGAEGEGEGEEEDDGDLVITCALPPVREVECPLIPGVAGVTERCMGDLDPYYAELKAEGVASIRSGEGKLLFLHIQKTGGTSLRKAIEKEYGHHPQTKEVGFPNPQDGYWLMHHLRGPDAERLPTFKALYGHFSFGVHSVFPSDVSYCYVTLLREPVARLISLYYYIQHFYPDPRNGKDLAEFMDPSRDFQYHNKDNGMTRALCGYEAWLAPFKGVRREHLLCAKENLRKYFALILLSERYDEGIELLSRTFAWEHPRRLETNVTPKYPKADEQDPLLIRQIIELNALDVELYAYAVELYEQQLLLFGMAA